MRDWLALIEDYIYLCRKRKLYKYSMFKLQMSLLADIVTTTESLAQYVKLVNNPESAKEWLPKGESIDEADIEYWKSALHSDQIVLSAIRDIGDGIAWRLFDYNRPLLYALTMNESSSNVQFNQGLVSEMNALGDSALEDGVAGFVLHAITNTGRIGDITKLYQDGSLEIVEVKSKGNPRGVKWKGRVEKQILRLENLSNLGNDGVGTVEGENLTLRNIDHIPRLALREIRQLIAQARVSGVAGRIIAEHLFIIAVEVEKVKSRDQFKHLREELVGRIRRQNDKIIMPTSLDFFEFSPHKAPLSVYPFDEETIARILLGRITLFYGFNVTRFLESLEINGWKVIDSVLSHPKTFDAKKEPFGILGKGALRVTLPAPLLCRAMYEGTSSADIIRLVEEIRKTADPESTSSMLVGFSGENKYWH